ncbi:MAG: hypothetical protein MUF06_16685 [Pirellulaceae bacterium]|nr:hypothetical protein [Pirellulaceae bacterium]
MASVHSILVVLAMSAADPERVNPDEVAGTSAQAESTNFKVRSLARGHDARATAVLCEQWRRKLQSFWCGEHREAWSPKCEVVVYPHRNAYLAQVGPGGGASYGSSLIDFDREKNVSRRRIDFRGDSSLGIESLPHELTHVVLADLLEGRQPPRWADEGMAMLADSAAKRALHERDLAMGLANRTAFRLPELFEIESYPHPTRVPAFYGQSVSVAALLAKRDDPVRFVEFLKLGERDGYDRALSQVYGIANVAALERLWLSERGAGRHGAQAVRLTLIEMPAARAATAIP